jgi:hypothetical protein
MRREMVERVRYWGWGERENGRGIKRKRKTDEKRISKKNN